MCGNWTRWTKMSNAKFIRMAKFVARHYPKADKDFLIDKLILLNKRMRLMEEDRKKNKY